MLQPLGKISLSMMTTVYQFFSYLARVEDEPATKHVLFAQSNLPQTTNLPNTNELQITGHLYIPCWTNARVVAWYQAHPKSKDKSLVKEEKGWNIYTAACCLHRDTERLEVSSLYPLHPTLTHTGSMRARHSAWGRPSRHQGFNYGCQAAPPEPVLRFDSNPKPSVRTRLVFGQETPGASRHSHVCDIRCVLLQHHRVPLKAIVKVCPHSGTAAPNEEDKCPKRNLWGVQVVTMQPSHHKNSGANIHKWLTMVWQKCIVWIYLYHLYPYI